MVVGSLIIWGTLYDIMLKNRIKKYATDLNSDSSGLNCTTYDLTGGADKKNCVGIGMPTGLNNNNSDENLAVVVLEEEKLSKNDFFNSIKHEKPVQTINIRFSKNIY